jgi:outer membrane protein TolC
LEQKNLSNLVKKFLSAVLLVATCIALDCSGQLRAETLYESILYLSKNQKQIMAAQADVDAARERVETAWGAWYPELSITTNWGREKQNKGSGTDDSEEHPREFGATVTQNVWDFGSTNSAIDSANLTLKCSSRNRSTFEFNSSK